MNRRARVSLMVVLAAVVAIVAGKMAVALLIEGCGARDLPDLAATLKQERVELLESVETAPVLYSPIMKVLAIQGRTATFQIAAPILSCCGSESDAYALIWKGIYDRHHGGLDYCVNVHIRWRGGGTDALHYTGHPWF